MANDAPPGPGWWKASNGQWYPPAAPPAPPPQQPVYVPPRRNSANWGCIAVAAVAPLAVLGGLVLLFVAGVAVESEQQATEPRCQAVSYHVEGTAVAVNITMTNATGDIEQFGPMALPLRNTAGREGLRIGCLPTSAFTSVIAQNQGEGGTVTCRIVRGGVVVAESTSTGAYVIATCSD